MSSPGLGGGGVPMGVLPPSVSGQQMLIPTQPQGPVSGGGGGGGGRLLSSCPRLHYLEAGNAGCSAADLLLVTRDGGRLHTHQALIAAAFSTIKQCLLEPRLAAEEGAVIYFPDHSVEQIQMLLTAAYGQISSDQFELLDPAVQTLMSECGYLSARYPQPGSIANIKTEIDIPDEEDLSKENYPANLFDDGGRRRRQSRYLPDEDESSSDEEYVPRKRKRKGRAVAKEMEDFIDDEDAEDDVAFFGKTEPILEDDDPADDDFEPRTMLDIEIKGEAEFDAEAGKCNQCHEDFTTEDDFNSHMPCSKAKKVFCEDCGALLNKYSLYNHRKHCQGARDSYPCLECGENVVGSLRRLDEHCADTHKSHAKVACRFCQAVHHWGGIGRHLSKCEHNPNRTLDNEGNPIVSKRRRGRPPKSSGSTNNVITNKAEPLANGQGYRCLAENCSVSHETKKDILKHYKQYHEQNYKCDHCDERLANKRDYQSHLKNVHDVLDDSRVMCDKCGYDVCKSGMKKHIEKCDGTMSSTARLFKKNDFKPHPEDPRRCPEPDCDFRHDSMGQVRLHYRKRHVKVACEHCNTKVSIYFYEEHLTKIHQLVTAKKAKLSCEECNLKFCFKSHLIEHMERVHIREPKYVCDICGAAHFSKRLLIQHRYETHVRSRKNTCEVCGVVMRSVKPLIQHLKDVHGVKVPKDYKPPGSTKQ